MYYNIILNQKISFKRAGMSDYNREQIKTAKDREDERRKKKAQTGTENVSILIYIA